jgi:ribose 5-phosphate isomerase B
MKTKIYIASDHAGVDFKEQLKNRNPNIEWIDLGTHSSDSVDYPNYSFAVARELKAHPGALGVLICGSGIGVSIAANRFNHLRAVLATTPEHARLGREHNHANVLCLGARITSLPDADLILAEFLAATPDPSDRHLRRIALLSSHGEK